MRVLNMMVWAYFFIYLTNAGTHIVLCSEDQVKGINGEFALKTCVRDCEFNLQIMSIISHYSMRLYILVQGGRTFISFLSSISESYCCESFICGSTRNLWYIKMSDKGKGKREHYLSDSSKVASRVQRKALWESRIFELELPQDIQNRITATEHRLWDELDSQKLKRKRRRCRNGFWILATLLGGRVFMKKSSRYSGL